MIKDICERHGWKYCNIFGDHYTIEDRYYVYPAKDKEIVVIELEDWSTLGKFSVSDFKRLMFRLL